MLCPKCNIEMDEARKLDVIIDSCSRCGGVWLDRGELDKIRGISSEYREYEKEHRFEGKKYDDHYNKGYESKHHSGHHKKKKGWRDIFEIFD